MSQYSAKSNPVVSAKYLSVDEFLEYSSKRLLDRPQSWIRSIENSILDPSPTCPYNGTTRLVLLYLLQRCKHKKTHTVSATHAEIALHIHKSKSTVKRSIATALKANKSTHTKIRLSCMSSKRIIKFGNKRQNANLYVLELREPANEA